MARRKYPSDLNSKIVRLNLGDYQLLAEISRRHNCTFAEAFHQLITEIAEREAIVVPKSQIRMIPMPVTTAYRATPITTIATNGSKAVAFKIKSKGVRYD